MPPLECVDSFTQSLPHVTARSAWWYAASQMGVQVQFLGLHVPALTAPVAGRPGEIAEFHESAGSIILVLAGLHALMALWHQFVLRDGTLSRMSLR